MVEAQANDSRRLTVLRSRRPMTHATLVAVQDLHPTAMFSANAGNSESFIPPQTQV